MLKYIICLVAIFLLYNYLFNNVESFNQLSNNLYVDTSLIQGDGLFTNIDLQTNDSIGILSEVYSKNKFKDGNGRYINHSKNNNIDLYIKVNKEDRIINVYGKANRFIKRGSELTANYDDKYAPKPNFINRNNFDFMMI
jgi:hypothetical protein